MLLALPCLHYPEGLSKEGLVRGIRRLAFGVLFMLGLLNPIAQAAPGYVDGNDVPVWQICSIIGTSAIASQNKVGFFTDPSTSYPKTGDVGYVRAVGSNISPCTNDTIGFDFFLPDGATLAIDSTNRVRCYAIKFTTPTQVIEFTNNPPTGFQGGCSQSPSIGARGGLFFGYAVVAPGWQVDIRVPVRYNKQLLGLAGPTTHRLTAVAQTASGDATPFVAVTVYYQASFQNLQSSEISATTAKLGVNLFSYFKSGQLYVDYGTTSSFGSTVPPATIPNNALNFPNVSTDLTGLTPNTTYFWRYRFVTDAGTFNSPTQTFTTLAASTFALNISRNGTGSGTVSSNPAGINCGATCSASFSSGASVVLSPVADTGSSFAGWSGACTGTGTCSITMDAAKTVTATFSSTPAGSPTITAAKPANAPTDATRNKGQSNVLMLAFTLNPSQATQLQSITLQASGSGNDNLDLTAVKLIRDTNANGQIDSGETPIATGTFSANNGTLTLTLSTPLALSPGTSQFLVAADIAGTLAARPAVLKAQSLPALPTPLLLTLLPFVLLGAWRMRSLRVGFLALALALALAACGGGGQNTTPANKTYQVSLTALSAGGSPTVSGLPIAGATITVQK